MAEAAEATWDHRESPVEKWESEIGRQSDAVDAWDDIGSKRGLEERVRV